MSAPDHRKPQRDTHGRVVRALFIPLSGQTRNRAGQQILQTAIFRPNTITITLVKNTVSYKILKRCAKNIQHPFYVFRAVQVHKGP